MSPPSQWFVCLRPVPEPAMRVFCLPYAGGGAAIFRPWRDELPDDIELWSLRMPGRETRYRERPFHRLGPLIDALADEFAPRLDVPFALFGHSLGALTAYELARRLERDGHRPLHLFVSAHRAPQVPPTSLPVHLSPDRVLLDRMRRYGGSPDAFYADPDLVAAVLPGLRADIAISETYRFDESLEPLRCPLTAFGGRSDRGVSTESVLAWREVAAGPFDAHLLDGGHFFWRDDPRPLLDLLRLRLVQLVDAQ